MTTCLSRVATAGLLYCFGPSITAVALDGSPLPFRYLPVVQTNPSDAGSTVVVSQTMSARPGAHVLTVTAADEQVDRSLTVVSGAPDRSAARASCLTIDMGPELSVAQTTLSSSTIGVAILVWGVHGRFRGVVPYSVYADAKDAPMVVRGLWPDGTLSDPFLYSRCTLHPERVTESGRRFELKGMRVRR